ncbi:MAG: Uma2 family endonuclease [Synechococcales bacterium]|nr:Uma2 family endonuclease [Synechococcales bacterium]
MTLAKSPQFQTFEDYLAAAPTDLPEGCYEYWDGELIETMPESLFHRVIANYLYFLLIQVGIRHELIHPGGIEVAVPGKPRTRYPDLLVLEEIHLSLLAKRATIAPTMPPPRLIVEIFLPAIKIQAITNEITKSKRPNTQRSPSQNIG